MKSSTARPPKKRRLYEAYSPYHNRRKPHSLASKSVGQKIGKYTIVEHIYADEVRALCDDCDRVTERRFCRLKDPCNCPIDITGRYFGMLKALRRSGRKNGTHDEWICLCCCGRETYGSARHLASGGKVSCGCVKTYLSVLGKLITYAKRELQQRSMK
jgi:hypothetical protein